MPLICFMTIRWLLFAHSRAAVEPEPKNLTNYTNKKTTFSPKSHVEQNRTHYPASLVVSFKPLSHEK